MIENRTIIKTIKKQDTSYIPIWLMRQAGRYMEEYRSIRSKSGSFMNLCLTPDIASEVTLQPINRFDFDAAIIFSDILVIPYAMGCSVDFIHGEGPKLSQIKDLSDITKLSVNIDEKLEPVYQAIKLTRRGLRNDKSLIGFAGSPWTISTYMLEGGSSKDFCKTKKNSIY